MSIFWLIPAAFFWITTALAWHLGAPGWVQCPLFGAACACTAVGAFIALALDQGAW